MMYAEWAKYRLTFKFDARTSRGSMHAKDTYFVRITDDDAGRCGWGECALFKGLSHDDHDDYEERLSEACNHIEDRSYLSPYSSIRFGIDTALATLANNAEGIVFDNDFGHGRLSIPINGLIWMGDKATMAERIDEKLAAGFKVLKLKIGGIDFNEELDLLWLIRSTFPAGTLEIRLDANGSFAPHEAMNKLERLAAFDIHSIEQPVKPGERLPGSSPIAIALDEELIGLHSDEQKHHMLRTLKPDYVILKPALCGGLNEASRWADIAEAEGVGWWATSALESNIGLNAIAQWVADRGIARPQGLGTGQLFTNNIPSPLQLIGDRLSYNPREQWSFPNLSWHR